MRKGPDLYRFWQNRFFIFGIVVGVEIIFSPFGRAQPSQDWKVCTGQGNPTSDQRAKACTAIIESQTEAPTSLRREFITLLGGAAAAWPRAVRAQSTEQLRRLGILMAVAESDADARAGIAILPCAPMRRLNLYADIMA